MKETLYNIVVVLLMASLPSAASVVQGKVVNKKDPVAYATVALKGTVFGVQTDSTGSFSITGIPSGKYTLAVSMIGFKPWQRLIEVGGKDNALITIELMESSSELAEVVVTGTMREVTKLASPVPVDLIPQKFLFKNPTPSIFEGLSYVNGVRPQINCNVCSTGDIHINGLEGPYTMVLIDGMPIVSGLSTVYGLIGIPNSLIDRVEIVKGPASSLYGSEAVGGLVNVITKNPSKAPMISADVFSSNWADVNMDIGVRVNAGKKVTSLIGVNYFSYQHPKDNNGDGFTDVTLQSRVSIFNRWAFERKDGRQANLAVRYLYEDRWGGEMRWNKRFRGGDQVYGESIYTNRWEILGAYQLPVKEKVTMQYSFNLHDQNSYYGTVPYMASQKIGFVQLLWEKKIKRHQLLTGVPFRYNYYDDNTAATTGEGGRSGADHMYLPGIFVQDEIELGAHTILASLRYDYNSRHGHIVTPRLAYKLNFNQTDAIRFNFGRGFRVVNLFTEDHAALTGAREVVILQQLRPEQSWNANLNYVKKIVIGNSFVGLDASVFHTRFSNRIMPDYDTNPNQIIYKNLNGFAVSQGVSLNVDYNFYIPLKITGGLTLMDNFQVDNGVRTRPVLTEKMMGTWAASYTFDKLDITVDYTGNVVGSMRLPVLGPDDPRPDHSPVWSLQNIQLTKQLGSSWEIYGGVKNLLNFRPAANAIARSFDPFDKQVEFDANGQVVATPSNPHRLTFDPSYVYAPNQGIRGFLGVRYTVR